MAIRTMTMLCVMLPTMAMAAPIDRQALVGRHDIRFRTVDPHAPVMLGNGELGFSADITGLQTFPDAYAPQSPLLTMAQWAWHRFPNPQGWRAADGMTPVPVAGRGVQPYAWFRDFDELKRRPALVWLRENPHRFSLARIGLRLVRRDGRRATIADLSGTAQRLDLWRGALVSRFVFDGAPVQVETRVAGATDAVLVAVTSPLVATGRVGVEVRYPGVARSLNPDPSDWAHPDAHRTAVVRRRPGAVELRRTIDATGLRSAIVAPGGQVVPDGPHGFRVAGRGERLVAMIGFGERTSGVPADYDAAARAADEGWRRYWQDGGMIDFAGSTDPRAPELERRVVLSQYLMRINAAGRVPPQEEGLFSNSWNGKFHLEMHGWHAAHFAAWGRAALLARSMDWYLAHLPQARARAAAHRVQGAWWPKMTGPDGEESPSPINPFIMWQQPHPIYLAELLRRADPASADRYAVLVEETAALLASWPLPDGRGGLKLGPPIVPVQENHDPLVTSDPAFELEYFRWGLTTAQAWRVRRGLARRPEWDRAIAALPAPAVAEGRYLPVVGGDRFWTDTLGRCRGDATPAGCLNRDHPSFLMAGGLIGGARIDGATMRATLDAVRRGWDLRQTWGWDFPMIAMTAARQGRPAEAIDWLFADQVNNHWGATGMTPRVDLDAGARGGPDGDGFRRIADTYFPSNGSLLLAVGMMAGGWDGAAGDAPGFPRAGWWVKAEGIGRLP